MRSPFNLDDRRSLENERLHNGSGPRIRCTFSLLTDPDHSWWHRGKGIAPVALPADLTPLVIQSGQAIAITTYPAGKGKPAVVHYLRVTRTDLAPASTQ